MTTVGDVVQRLLPEGTRPNSYRWRRCPQWPPDVFAVATTLLERTGIYAHERYSGRSGGGGLFGPAYRRRVADNGRRWRANIGVPRDVQRAWRTVAAAWNVPLEAIGSRAGAFWDDVFRLAASADEASEGLGFAHPDASPIADLVVFAYREYARGGPPLLPAVPWSVAWLVPASEACVQPKTRTSQVGCTIRCLSHHLALLPPASDAKAAWFAVWQPSDEERPLNLLLVPFPYRIAGSAFVAGGDIDDAGSSSSHFRVAQTWLRSSRSSLSAFIARLVREAEREVGRVHGIVLPELAIDHRTALALGRRFRRRGLDLFVAGVVEPPTRRGGPPRNAIVARGYRGRVGWVQAKHHRWKLDGRQIRRYHLGHVLDPGRSWWEEIDVARRELHFAVFRPGASVCALVCEDLARADPVQPVVRAIGPNLVIALLMDGPQTESRWPGQYAGVLSDDPGSSVLTLTSLGFLRRSVAPGEDEPREVALWKDSRSGAKALRLPDGAHALCLCINTASVTNWSLDGRSDGGGTIDLSLGAVRAIRHPSPPVWAT